MTGLGWRHRRSAHPHAYVATVRGMVHLLRGAAPVGISSLVAAQSPYAILFGSLGFPESPRCGLPSSSSSGRLGLVGHSQAGSRPDGG